MNKTNFVTMATSLVIYEDNARLRQSLELLLGDDNDFKVVGAFSNCVKVKEQMDQLLPQLVIMDIDMPGMNGIEGVKTIKSCTPYLTTTTAYSIVSAQVQTGIC
jgi:DNA-binding NarL/FixJ family response regulator